MIESRGSLVYNVNVRHLQAMMKDFTIVLSSLLDEATTTW
jgi:hypothetical protein